MAMILICPLTTTDYIKYQRQLRHTIHGEDDTFQSKYGEHEYIHSNIKDKYVVLFKENTWQIQLEE